MFTLGKKRRGPPTTASGAEQADARLPHSPWSRALVELALAASALYLLFVWAYPRVFPSVEKAHPANYKANVAEAVALGNVDKALKIVRQAASVFGDDPAVFTLWGELLLRKNDVEAATAQFRRAVNIGWTRRGLPRTDAQGAASGPGHRDTDRPYYYAPARVALGKLAADAGRPWDALCEFESALPYADVTSPEFNSYRGLMSSLYAQASQWPRALEFTEPSAIDLSSLGDDDLLAIGTVMEGRQQWEALLRVAAEWSARSPNAPAGVYLSGRAHFSLGEYEQAAANLEKASSLGHPDAPFFLGLTLGRTGKTRAAVQALLQTGAESLFHPFALARAVVVQPDISEGQRQERLDELDRALKRERRLQAPSLHDENTRFQLIALDWQESRPGAGGPSPVVCLWRESPTAFSMPPMELLVQVENSGACTLKRSDLILQLQWPVNALSFFGFEHIPAGETELPGWRKTVRLWPDKPGSRTASVVAEDGNGSVLQISNHNAEASAVLVSAPVLVHHPGKGYVLAARAKASNATARLTWAALDEGEHPASETAMTVSPGGDWTWLFGYLHAPVVWYEMTLQVGIVREAGTVAYADLMLLEIKEPALMSPW